ncbi:hypothetical protein [Sulfoacidibacillus ferrooxidans]|uniref:Uncharacterized protein n=1 Tax=Sulfoacidibacillus ferrooxidans TaxID=2005001 RepID=A0A9X1V9P4_9BACL|nr:hypothetical protein [Sulfoacidibacillus ferrooxidans]MCI0183948.1 hypothetical protein [Sulfoacidibacillus ferrooxidans]
MMENQYRLVKVTQSDGPSHEQSDHVHDNDYGQREFSKNEHSQKHHPVLWLLGILAVVFIVAVAIWMNSVSSSLGHTNQIVTSNATQLSHVSNQLTSIQVWIRAISQQLNQLQNEISNIATIALSHLNHH